MLQKCAHKRNLELHHKTVHIVIMMYVTGVNNLSRQLRGDFFVRVYTIYPSGLNLHVVERPIELTGIMDKRLVMIDFCSKSLCQRYSLICTATINHNYTINPILNGLNTSLNIYLFILCEDNRSYIIHITKDLLYTTQ